MRIIDLEELERNLKKADELIDEIRPQLAQLSKVIENYIEKRNSNANRK